MTIIYLASALFVILFIAAMAQFVISAADRRQIVAGALQGTVKQEPPGSRFDRLSRRFNTTRFGRYLERDLVLAGITFPPILVFAGLVVATIAIPYLLVASVLYWLTGILSFVAFFTILFTKKIPRELFELMVPGLRWNLRGNAYAYFVTERYPPFVWG